MTFNSQKIIQDIRTEFEHLLDFVTGGYCSGIENEALSKS